MEIERGPGYVIFDNFDGTYWSNVMENACSDDLPSIDAARQWAVDMLPAYYLEWMK
jgi:hypothetical protein